MSVKANFLDHPIRNPKPLKWVVINDGTDFTTSLTDSSSKNGVLSYTGDSAQTLYYYNDMDLNNLATYAGAFPSTAVAYAIAEDRIGEEEEWTSINIGNFHKFAVIGDSYASGWTYEDENNYGDNYSLSWGQCLARKYNITCVNASKGGLTTKTWYTDSTYGEANADYNGGTLPLTECDLVIICLGGNDITQEYTLGTIADIPAEDHTYGNDVTDSTYGYYGAIIQHLLNNTSAKIVLSTTIIADSSKVSELEALNTAVIELADHYGLPYVVQTDDSFFDATGPLGQHFVASHPTALGYTGYASAMDRLLSKCMSDNATYFNSYTEPIMDDEWGYNSKPLVFQVALCSKTNNDDGTATYTPYTSTFNYNGNKEFTLYYYHDPYLQQSINTYSGAICSVGSANAMAGLAYNAAVSYTDQAISTAINSSY